MSPAVSISSTVKLLDLFLHFLDPQEKNRSPREIGDRLWAETEDAPALSPKMVIRSGSPPKYEISSHTHRRARDCKLY